MKFQVYYKKPCPGSDEVRCYCCGFDPNPGLTIADVVGDPRPVFPRFVLVREVDVQSIDRVYLEMQGEVWSPNGEARELIMSLGLWHTSMSVGDVAIDENGNGWQCDYVGWIQLPANPAEVAA